MDVETPKWVKVIQGRGGNDAAKRGSEKESPRLWPRFKVGCWRLQISDEHEKRVTKPTSHDLNSCLDFGISCTGTEKDSASCLSGADRD